VAPLVTVLKPFHLNPPRLRPHAGESTQFTQKGVFPVSLFCRSTPAAHFVYIPVQLAHQLLLVEEKSWKKSGE